MVRIVWYNRDWTLGYSPSKDTWREGLPVVKSRLVLSSRGTILFLSVCSTISLSLLTNCHVASKHLILLRELIIVIIFDNVEPDVF